MTSVAVSPKSSDVAVGHSDGMLRVYLEFAKQQRYFARRKEKDLRCNTVGKYALSFDKDCFILESKQTACLAEDQCGIVPQSESVNRDSEDNSGNSACAPGSGCC